VIISDIETTEKVEYEDLLKNYYEKMEIIEEQDKEIERLHSIIKEVREYIEEKYDYILGDDTFLDHDERIERKQIDHILEILDKEVK
jgi:hypothetical protein